MHHSFVQSELDALAATPGVHSCALVERASGLVWCSAGQPSEPALWEAAVDYWRLYLRTQQHYHHMGELRVAVMYHLRNVLALLPSNEAGDLLVVCVAAHQGVDWIAWQRRVRAMGAKLVEG